MLLFTICPFFLYSFLPIPATGLRCFTCLDATSNEDCNAYGKVVTCAANEVSENIRKLCEYHINTKPIPHCLQQSCQNEVRLSEGNKYRITKRCKQNLACYNNQAQNDQPAWEPNQCNPPFRQNSVCRCCCESDLCNEEEMPCDEKPKCPKLKAMKNGTTTCKNMNFLDSECSFHCNEGFLLVGSRDTKCTNHQRGLRWDSNVPTCQRTTCSGDVLINQTAARVSCSDLNYYSSTCEFSCDNGYQLRGPLQVVCNEDGEWSEEFPSCERITCGSSEMQVANGEVVCSDNNYYSSLCVAECVPGYDLEGEATFMCGLNGEWNRAAPQCVRVTCEQSAAQVDNGAVVCTDDNFYTSMCTFQCFLGYYLEGEATLTCQENGNWNRVAPKCIRASCAEKRSSPLNGEVTCTDENWIFSSCSFSCIEDSSTRWKMQGQNITTCQQNPLTSAYEWSYDETPCCSRNCPPNALVDLFLVLDSSSSVGSENWNRTLYFISDVIDQFEISEEDVLVAAIRYNRFVDTVNEIQIGQYTTKEATTQAIINMPYDGSGTYTGNALTYVLDSMLTNPGNREEAKDLVFVVTDGISSDDVITPAQKLRDFGALVLALGVVNKGGTLEKKDIAEIAGSPETAFLIDSGFEGLSLNVVDLIEKQVCGDDPCAS